MMLWWLKNLSRANHERQQLFKLAEQKDWLKNLQINLGDGNLEAQFDIEHGSEIFELVLTYPVVFPDAPPLVKTRNDMRISGHQYGASGELCLEYRPDNWQPDVTGTMMIESTYKLLCGENPSEGSERPEIVDGHAVSIGQATRRAWGRFVITLEDITALQDLEENVVIPGILGECIQDKTFSARLMQIGDADSHKWVSKSKFASSTAKINVYIVNRPELELANFPSHNDVAKLIDTAANDIFDHKHLEDGGTFSLLVSYQDSWTLYWVSSKGENPIVCAYRTLLEGNLGRRLPKELEQLRQAKIGIVGCGSMGSKIAMQLARSGVTSFLLIDDDVFFESNLVRNELSAADIGFHKTRALRKRLLAVDQQLSIETRQIKLGGQESSESTVSAMEQLANCDLIVDATADANAFNIIAAVCKRERIPVVWGSVFAGGIGGIVGRALPDHDPEPLDARQQTRSWCESQGVDAPGVSNDNTPYEAQSDEGGPVVATDADVSVMAAHVARFAIDTISRPGSSIFPYSAYAIGLSRAWVFLEPFDTRPIVFINQKKWGSDEEEATLEEKMEFLKSLQPLESEDGT